MRATCIKAFPGVPDGAYYPKEIQPGDVIEGSLAAAAVKAGWAEALPDETGAEQDQPAPPAPTEDPPAEAAAAAGNGKKKNK